MADEIHRLRLNLPDHVPFIASGAAAIKHKALLDVPGIFAPANLSRFRDMLADIQH